MRIPSSVQAKAGEQSAWAAALRPDLPLFKHCAALDPIVHFLERMRSVAVHVRTRGSATPPWPQSRPFPARLRRGGGRRGQLAQFPAHGDETASCPSPGTRASPSTPRPRGTITLLGPFRHHLQLYSAGIDGTGQARGHRRPHPSVQQAWSTFRSLMGLPVSACRDPEWPRSGRSWSGEDGEADLDVEWSGEWPRTPPSSSSYRSPPEHGWGGPVAQYIVNNNLGVAMSTGLPRRPRISSTPPPAPRAWRRTDSRSAPWPLRTSQSWCSSPPQGCC